MHRLLLPAAHAGFEFLQGNLGGLADPFELVNGREVPSADIAGGHLEFPAPDGPLPSLVLHLHESRRADEGAGAAADAGLGDVFDLRFLDVPAQSAVQEFQSVHADDLVAGPGAETAEDAVVAFHRRRGDLDPQLLRHVPHRLRRGVLVVEQFGRELPALFHLVRIRPDFHPGGDAGAAGGGQLPLSVCLHLYGAEAAGAEGDEVLVETEGRNLDLQVLQIFEDGGTLLGFDLTSVDRDAYHYKPLKI